MFRRDSRIACEESPRDNNISSDYSDGDAQALSKWVQKVSSQRPPMVSFFPNNSFDSNCKIRNKRCGELRYTSRRALRRHETSTSVVSDLTMEGEIGESDENSKVLSANRHDAKVLSKWIQKEAETTMLRPSCFGVSEPSAASTASQHDSMFEANLTTQGNKMEEIVFQRDDKNADYQTTDIEQQVEHASQARISNRFQRYRTRLKYTVSRRASRRLSSPWGTQRNSFLTDFDSDSGIRKGKDCDYIQKPSQKQERHLPMVAEESPMATLLVRPVVSGLSDISEPSVAPVESSQKTICSNHVRDPCKPPTHNMTNPERTFRAPRTSRSLTVLRNMYIRRSQRRLSGSEYRSLPGLDHQVGFRTSQTTIASSSTDTCNNNKSTREAAIMAKALSPGSQKRLAHKRSNDVRRIHSYRAAGRPRRNSRPTRRCASDLCANAANTNSHGKTRETIPNGFIRDGMSQANLKSASGNRSKASSQQRISKRPANILSPSGDTPLVVGPGAFSCGGSSLHGSDDTCSHNIAAHASVVVANKVPNAVPIVYPSETAKARKSTSIFCVIINVMLLSVVVVAVVVGRTVRRQNNQSSHIDPGGGNNYIFEACSSMEREEDVLHQCFCQGTISNLNPQLLPIYSAVSRELFAAGALPEKNLNETLTSCGSSSFSRLMIAQLGATEDLVPLYSLIFLYYTWNGLMWREQQGWLETPHLCEWEGIRCNFQGDPIQLRLSDNRLNGTMPTEIQLLTTLQKVWLGDNQVHGDLPHDIFLPLTNLRMLDLASTELQGQLKDALPNLEHISRVDVNGNNFIGGIPDYIGSLTKLKGLDISQNPVGGSIPSSLGQLSGLERLEMESCHLQGTLPSELGMLSVLEVAEIGGNMISGAIPDTFVNMEHLITMDLRETRLSGTVPDGMCDLWFLQSITGNCTGNFPIASGCACCFCSETGEYAGRPPF